MQAVRRCIDLPGAAYRVIQNGDANRIGMKTDVETGAGRMRRLDTQSDYFNFRFSYEYKEAGIMNSATIMSKFFGATVASIAFRKTALCGAIFTVCMLANAGSVEDSIAERIKPVGTVCVAGEECAKGLTVASAGAKSGEEVYNTSCLACHASGAAGAPKFRNAGDWAARLTAGLESNYANAIGGKGAMPAKGLCMSCSDDEIKAAVDHMIKGL